MLPGYPKVMRHPAYTKGVAQEVWPKGYKPKPGEVEFPGTSDRFPDVTVTNPDQQEWHESRGYHCTDGSTLLGTPVDQGFQEYPKWITPGPDAEDVLVTSLEHESQVMGHNKPKSESKVAVKAVNKGGRPKGSKNKPATDRMKATD